MVYLKDEMAIHSTVESQYRFAFYPNSHSPPGLLQFLLCPFLLAGYLNRANLHLTYYRTLKIVTESV